MIFSAVTLMAMLDWNVDTPQGKAPCRTLWEVCMNEGCEKAFLPSEQTKSPFKNFHFYNDCTQESERTKSLVGACNLVERRGHDSGLCTGNLHTEAQ